MKVTNHLILTFDLDWASDDILRYVYKKLKMFNVKSTWFITHESKFIKDVLLKSPIIEGGIHPNFLQKSTHGNSEDEVLSYFKFFLKDAKSVRTHALYQSSPLLMKMCVEYDIKYDSSIFLPETFNLTYHIINYSSSKKLIRFPYNWGDFNCLLTPSKFLIKEYLKSPGLKIMNFHPIHIALNSNSLHQYKALKEASNLNDVSFSELESYKNNDSFGMENIFNEVLSYLKDVETFTLSELGNNILRNQYDRN